MDQDYHDAAQELYDTPAMVCLTHGRFIPCRKQGEHLTSTDPADIEKVRYHQEVSVRLQSMPPPTPPEFREVGIPAEQWPYTVAEFYGSPELKCGGQVIYQSDNRSRPGQRHLVSCRTRFSADNPAELIAEIRRHILVTPHYEVVPEG
jgi:hypothetical protein